MIRKRVEGVIALLLFIIAAAFVFSRVYNALRWKDTLGSYLSSTEQMYATEENLADVVFVGSSHCYNAFYPAYLWRDHGYAAFDMTTSGQDRDSSYHFLREILKYQNPKVVFVETYGLCFDEHHIEGNIYRNLLSMKTSANSVGLVNDYVSKYGDKEDIPDYIARFPIIHTRYRELERKDFTGSKINTFARGTDYVFTVNNIGVYGTEEETDENIVLSEDKMNWLNKLYDLSLKEGFDLVLVAAPYQIYGADISYLDRAADFAAEKGLTFFNFNRMGNEIGINAATDFSDSKHCNAYGAEKITSFIADFLEENYDLPDHRGDKRYWQWDEDLKWYERRKVINDMQNAQDSISFAKAIAASEGLTAIISLEGRYGENYEEQYADFFNYLGVEHSSYEEGGKWIAGDGMIQKVYLNDPDRAPFVRQLSKYDTLKIDYEGDFLFPGNICIGDEGYSNIGCCLAIIVYDNVSEEVVIHKGF